MKLTPTVDKTIEAPLTKMWRNRGCLQLSGNNNNNNVNLGNYILIEDDLVLSEQKFGVKVVLDTSDVVLEFFVQFFCSI